jgi:hypothetical protein
MHRGILLAMRPMKSCALALAALLASCVAGCGDDATPCDVHADCNGSKESLEAGRCGPSSACVDGECIAWCPQRCGPLADDDAPCEDGYVCTEPMSGPAGRPICSATEIECEDAAQCPKERPGDGEWTCEDQVCRFPGFSYLYPQP